MLPAAHVDVIDELRRHGCHLTTIADGFDLDGPAAEIVLAVLAWAAKMERVAINERIAAARDRIERDGRRWGRPRRMTATDVERASAMRAEGRTVREIAVAMKVPRSTIARALSSVSQKDGAAANAETSGETPIEPPRP